MPSHKQFANRVLWYFWHRTNLQYKKMFKQRFSEKDNSSDDMSIFLYIAKRIGYKTFFLHLMGEKQSPQQQKVSLQRIRY